jgi:predicted nucleic acid-binding protein
MTITVIAATCRVHGYPIVSHDRAITRSKLVRQWQPSPPVKE